jgi:excisionase family DNA binding protein
MTEYGTIINGVKLYTTEEISKILNIHLRTAQIYIHKGKLKGQRIGRRWYVADETLKEFLKGN